MYQQILNFVLVTQNDHLEYILGEIAPPEDCQYRFETIPPGQQVTVPALDGAVVIDYSETVPESVTLPSDCLCAVILQAGDLKRAADVLTPSSVDFWVIDGTPVENAGLLQAYFSNVLQRMKEHADYRKMKICMETALDSIPDLAWFKSPDGAHMMVNQGFCYAVQKTKDQIYKKGHYYVWDIPKEEYEAGDYVCLESEQEVMDAGRTCLFDEKVKTKSGMRKFKTYKSPLYDVDGTLFGTCGIAQDVTEFGNLTNELMMLLESMSFAVIVENANGIILSINARFCEYFPQYMDIEGQPFELWKKNAIDSGAISSFESEMRVMSKAGERILLMEEESIFDVFDQLLGKLRIFRDITTERKYAEQMWHYANTDFMTGLNNRRSLFAYLAEKKHAKQLTFLTIDLDNFKSVNDRYGHHMGDNAILIAVSTINEFFPDDFKARLGGDEFLVVIDHPIEKELVQQQAKQFMQILVKNFQEKQELCDMTASIGIATSYGSKNKSHDIDQVMQNSDRALYAAKYAGKAGIYFYDEEFSTNRK